MSVRTHVVTYVCVRSRAMSVRTHVVTYVCVGSRAMSVRTYVSGAEHECMYVRMCREQSNECAYAVGLLHLMGTS